MLRYTCSTCVSPINQSINHRHTAKWSRSNGTQHRGGTSTRMSCSLPPRTHLPLLRGNGLVVVRPQLEDFWVHRGGIHQGDGCGGPALNPCIASIGGGKEGHHRSGCGARVWQPRPTHAHYLPLLQTPSGGRTLALRQLRKQQLTLCSVTPSPHSLPSLPSAMCPGPRTIRT